MHGNESKLKEAQRLLDCGDVFEARRVCAATLAAQPDDWRSHITMTRIELAARHFERALEYLNLAEDYGAPEDTVDRLENHLAARLGKPAHPLADDAGEMPTEPGSALRIIKGHLRAGRLAETLSGLEALVRAFPDADIGDRFLAKLRERVGADAFAARLEGMLAVAPENFSLRVRCATGMLEAGDLDGASTQVHTALAIDSTGVLPPAFWSALDELAARGDGSSSCAPLLVRRPANADAVDACLADVSRAQALGEARALFDRDWPAPMQAS
ncbi:MAG: hypothetical protein AAFW98_02055 [Pseudomonadota bacterium]